MLRFLCHSILHPLVRLRFYLYKFDILKSYRLPCQVISVGNITTGGTGKSPLVISLCEYLLDKGFRPVILTRGYKSSLSKGQSILFKGGAMELNHGPSLKGEPHADEARMQAEKLLGRVDVVVGQNRVLAAQHYLKKHKMPTHFILDDGFSHLRIKRDIDLLLFDHEDPLGRKSGFPLDILREPFFAGKRADAVLLTRKKEGKSSIEDKLSKWQVPYWPIPFENLSPHSFEGSQFDPKVSFGLVTAIAHPDRLRQQLPYRVKEVLIKKDHETFSRKEIEKICQLVDAIITTEKDYWRTPDIFSGLEKPYFVLPIKATLPEGLCAFLASR